MMMKGDLPIEKMDEIDDSSLGMIIEYLEKMMAEKGRSMKGPSMMAVEIEAKDASDPVAAGVMDAEEDEENC